MVKEAKQPKREHPCPHCLTKFRSPSHRNAHVRAVHENEKWRHCSLQPCAGGVAVAARSKTTLTISYA